MSKEYFKILSGNTDIIAINTINHHQYFDTVSSVLSDNTKFLK